MPAPFPGASARAGSYATGGPPGVPAGDEGIIDTYAVNADARPADRQRADRLGPLRVHLQQAGRPAHQRAVRRSGGPDQGRRGVGASDEALSRDSRYLYALNSFAGTIDAFRVGPRGELQHLQEIPAQGPSEMAAGIGLAAL